MKRSSINISLLIGLSALVLAGCSQPPPQTAQEVLERSFAAQGGDSLTQWNTLTIKGTVVILLVDKPDKLRLEQDMTADRGRLFYEYFLNSGVAWSRTNLIPRPGDLKQMKRLLNQCDGIAY